MCEYCDAKEKDDSFSLNYSTESFYGGWCSASIIYTGKDINGQYGIEDQVLKPNTYYLAADGDASGYTKINYCPMCGRKLGD
ncbi:hypothetical protein CPEBRM1_ABPJDJAI_00882 [Companilactobacillus paralimentarius]|uniref:hypothetical protein n=1 Tax=Companilactobacillus paralimentarius TaxID=83526 RepID=UPI00384F6D77